MARVNGYGGLGNTNGARNFAGKVLAIIADLGDKLIRVGVTFVKTGAQMVTIVSPDNDPVREYNT